MRSGTIYPIDRPARRKSIRIAAGIISTFDAVAWLLLLATYFWSAGDPATKRLDEAAAWVTTGLFACTGGPALVLAVRDQAPGAAVILALAFPAVFVALVVAYALP